MRLCMMISARYQLCLYSLEAYNKSWFFCRNWLSFDLFLFIARHFSIEQICGLFCRYGKIDSL